MTCKKCGKPIPEDAKYCTYCGERVIGMLQSSTTEQKMVYDEPEVKIMKERVFVADNVTTIFGWFGWIIFTHFLPIVGTLCMAWGSKSKSTQNYGKALLIIQLIIMVYAIIEWRKFSDIFEWIFS